MSPKKRSLEIAHPRRRCTPVSLPVDTSSGPPFLLHRLRLPSPTLPGFPS